jgi:two-component system OmpR family sensor kinase
MSIYKRLLIWLIPALILTTAIAGAAIYMKTLSEVNEMQDYTLRQTAYSMRYSNRLTFSDNEGNSDNEANESASDNDDFELIGQIWDKDGRLTLSTHPEKNIPLLNTKGIATVLWQNQKWRVFSISTKDSVIQVAQPFDVREEASADIAESATLPVVILIPILGLLIMGGVAFGLRPLKHITSALENRHADSMEPLAFQNLPEEIKMMVLSLNALLNRLSRSIEHQKQFIEDAAHELRTPLTALSLQVEIVSRSTDKHEISDALSNLKQGIKRSTHLVEQLLTLARQQHVIKQTHFEIIDLVELAEDVIDELAPIANSKSIDLGLTCEGMSSITGNHESLRTMLVNLVDNSIRYTPVGGKVKIKISTVASKCILEIIDSGAGIPLANRDRVFDRFFRGLGHSTIGSGLGLAIVKSIADRHQAVIQLDEGEMGIGLTARISFPGTSTS